MKPKESEMISASVSAAMIASALVAPATEEPSASGRIPAIKFEKYTLPNGLDVILH